MASGEERRKSIRMPVRTECYFNILGSAKEYLRGHDSILKRLGVIDSVKIPPVRNESQLLLSCINQKLSLIVKAMAEKASARKSYVNHAVVINISEHGLAFVDSRLMEKGTPLEIGFQLPSDDNAGMMDIGGTVVNVRPSPESEDSMKYTYGVEFFDIQNKDQDYIVQWIFAHQREQLRRRRGQEG
jgi:hypothetical protein